MPQFQRWKLYARWRQCLEDLGYKLTEIPILASHHGVPQRRLRTFVVAMRRRRFAFEHPKDPREPAFGPCIDWDAGRWRPFSECKGHSARARLEAAAAKYRRSIVQHVSLSTKAKAATGLSLREPIRTITTKDQWIVVRGRSYRPLTIRENARGMGFPDDYAWPVDAGRRATITGLGNAVCPPVGEELAAQVMAAM